MRSQEMRLRHKRSHTLCDRVNFIFGEPGTGALAGTAAGRGEKTRQEKKGVKSQKPQRARKRSAGAGGEISHHHHGFDDVQRCPFGSVSVQAWRPRRGRSPAARWQGGEQEGSEEESKRATRTMCCPFIGAFAHAQSMSAYMQFLPCMLPA